MRTSCPCFFGARAAALALVLTAGSCVPGACASRPPAEVSREQLGATRAAHAALAPGTPKSEVLAVFAHGNVVRLGAAQIQGASVEEWKVEAFTEKNDRKDLFVTFLYFCNDRLADTSDTRIDFRANTAIVDRWRAPSP